MLPQPALNSSLLSIIDLLPVGVSVSHLHSGHRVNKKFPHHGLIVSFRRRQELVETSQMPLLLESKNSWRGFILVSGQRKYRYPSQRIALAGSLIVSPFHFTRVERKNRLRGQWLSS